MKLSTKIIRTYLSCKGNKTLQAIATELGVSEMNVSNAITAYFKKRKTRFHKS